MVNRCAVPLCESIKGKTKGISFHEFPSDYQFREKWLKNIRVEGKQSLKSWIPTDRTLVCSLHFDESEYVEGLKVKRLKKSAVPTIFNEYPTYLKRGLLKSSKKRGRPTASGKPQKKKQTENAEGRGKKSSAFQLNTSTVENKELIGTEVRIKSEFVANDNTDSCHDDRDPLHIDRVQTSNGLFGEVKAENQDESDLTSTVPISVHIGHLVLVNDIKKELEPEVEDTLARTEEVDPLHIDLDLDLTSDCVANVAGEKYQGNPGARIPNILRQRRFSNLEGHEVVENFKCNICGKYFPTSKILIDHNVTHIQDRKYECRKCGYSFVYEHRLTKHLKGCPKKEKPPGTCVKCVTCGKIFTNQSNLDKHTITHTIEKPHECDTCGFRSKTMSKLSRHKKIHHTEKLSFECKFCKQKFNDPSYLKSHIRRFYGKKLLNCVFCGKPFHNLSGLNVHKRDEHRDMRQKYVYSFLLK